MARNFAFIEHRQPIICSQCNQVVTHGNASSDVTFMVDDTGALRRFEDGFVLAPGTELSVRCARGHEVRFRTDGHNHIFRTQANSPLQTPRTAKIV